MLPSRIYDCFYLNCGVGDLIGLFEVFTRLRLTDTMAASE
jgi:hypothetical protein